MLSNQSDDLNQFVNLLNQLSKKAAHRYPLIKDILKWPQHIPATTLWMSQELLSVYGTKIMQDLDASQLYNLAKWESVNFYSLNVHGIRALLTAVIARIHTPGFEIISEFLHHFIEEENEHMQFFAYFCLHYGEKLYPFAAKQ